MVKKRRWRWLSILLACGLIALSGCSLSGSGGTGRSSRMGGRIRLPFDFSLGGGGKRLDCDPETERIGRVDGELACVSLLSPDPESDSDE
jgi:hypothetical protein